MMVGLEHIFIAATAKRKWNTEIKETFLENGSIQGHNWALTGLFISISLDNPNPQCDGGAGAYLHHGDARAAPGRDPHHKARARVTPSRHPSMLNSRESVCNKFQVERVWYI